LSSAVEINLAVPREILDLFLKVVWFKADRSRNALGMSVVVAVTTNIRHYDVRPFFRCQTLRQLLHRYSGDAVEQAVFMVKPDASASLSSHADSQLNFGRGGTRTKVSGN